jgi:hypothetical protein
VEVALDAAALLIGRVCDPGPGSVQLSELAVEIDIEPGDLDGEPAATRSRCVPQRRAPGRR